MNEAAKPTTVLVVDDEALIRLYAVDVLNDAGHRTLEAGDASEALELLKQHPEIRVLFTDINMPGPFDGLQLARQVHSLRPDVQLIITSGRERLTAADIPYDGDFVSKPFQAAALTDLIAAGAKR